MPTNKVLWSGRSWLRKGLEAWFTALIEVLWPKQRILEVYLNSAEWDEGVFGAEAAAQHHFGVSAKKLSRQQASYLAAVLPSPLNWSASHPSTYVSRRAGWNIVTALQGHENFGLEQMPSAEERYERAAEFTSVVQQLWASFPTRH